MHIIYASIFIKTAKINGNTLHSMITTGTCTVDVLVSRNYCWISRVVILWNSKPILSCNWQWSRRKFTSLVISISGDYSIVHFTLLELVEKYPTGLQINNGY